MTKIRYVPILILLAATLALTLPACDYITGTGEATPASTVAIPPEVSSVASVSENSTYYHEETVYPFVAMPKCYPVTFT